MAKYDVNKIFEWPVIGQVLILSVIFFSVLYLGYLWDLSNMTRKLNAARQEELDAKQQFQMLFKKEMNLEAELMQLPQIEKLFAQWQKKIIKPAELPELLNSILKIGTVNQLQFNLFNPGVKVAEKKYFKIPIKILITGNYNQIATFISQIANMPWLIRANNLILTKIDLSGLTKVTDAPAPLDEKINAELTLEVYQFEPK
jgi:type IV pilus assembly protein PilO